MACSIEPMGCTDAFTNTALNMSSSIEPKGYTGVPGTDALD